MRLSHMSCIQVYYYILDKIDNSLSCHTNVIVSCEFYLHLFYTIQFDYLPMPHLLHT